MSSPPAEKKLSHVVPVVVFIFPLIHGIFTAICYYKGRQLQKKYRMDVVVGDIIVELKSVSKILEEHRAQLFNYLRLTKKPVGLLVNFGERGLMCERYAFDESCNECILLDKNMNPFY